MQSNQEKLQQFLAKAKKDALYRRAILNNHHQFDLSLRELLKISPKSIVHMRKHFFNQLEQTDEKTIKTDYQSIDWEKRMLVWILLSFLEINGKSTEEDFKFLSEITLEKQIRLIKYQIFSSLKQPKRPKWTNEEDEILTNLLTVGQQFQAKGQWSRIAKELYLRGDQQEYKSARNCRQRWLNHLDPSLSKEWTPQEDLRLLTFIKQQGKTWCKIVPLLHTKSQHMIKNRYHSLIRKASKKLNKRCKEEDMIDFIIRGGTKQICEKKKQRKQEEPKKEKKEKEQSTIKVTITPQPVKIEEPEQIVKKEENLYGMALIKSQNYQVESQQIEQEDGNFTELNKLLGKNIIKEDDNDPLRMSEFRLNESLRFPASSPLPVTPYNLFLAKQGKEKPNFQKMCYQFSSCAENDIK